jgi:hypothetical protein
MGACHFYKFSRHRRYPEKDLATTDLLPEGPLRDRCRAAAQTDRKTPCVVGKVAEEYAVPEEGEAWEGPTASVEVRKAQARKEGIVRKAPGATVLTEYRHGRSGRWLRAGGPGRKRRFSSMSAQFSADMLEERGWSKNVRAEVDEWIAEEARAQDEQNEDDDGYFGADEDDVEPAKQRPNEFNAWMNLKRIAPKVGWASFCARTEEEKKDTVKNWSRMLGQTPAERKAERNERARERKQAHRITKEDRGITSEAGPATLRAELAKARAEAAKRDREQKREAESIRKQANEVRCSTDPVLSKFTNALLEQDHDEDEVPPLWELRKEGTNYFTWGVPSHEDTVVHRVLIHRAMGAEKGKRNLGRKQYITEWERGCKFCRHQDGVPDFEKALGATAAGKLQKFKKVVHESPCVAAMFCVCGEETCHLQSVKNALCKIICMKPA